MSRARMLLRTEDDERSFEITVWDVTNGKPSAEDKRRQMKYEAEDAREQVKTMQKVCK